MNKFGLIVVLVLALGVFTAAAYAGVVQHATGSGHFYPDDGISRTFAFSATTRASGITKGQAQIVRHDLGTKLHVAVDCLNTFPINSPPLVGTVAVMSGFDTPASTDSSEGFYWTFAVIDGSEGRDSVDWFSLAIGATSPEIQSCVNFGQIAVSPITDGNVQVK
jgi:hypothetical protein